MKTRRDDIESAIYMIIFLINKNRLPWIPVYKDQSLNLSQKLKLRTETHYQIKFIDVVPKQLKDCVIKVLKLNFNEEPPYDYIITTLKKYFYEITI